MKIHNLILHFKLLVDHFCGSMLYSPCGTSAGGGPNVDFNSNPMLRTEKPGSLAHPVGYPQFNVPMTKQCIPISMTMEISPIHHSIVLGKVSNLVNRRQIKYILNIETSV